LTRDDTILQHSTSVPLASHYCTQI